MVARLENAVLDGGLTVLHDSVSYIYICSSEPTDYTQASSTYALGVKNLGAGSTFSAPALSSSPVGRKVSASISGGSVSVDGSALWWAATDGSQLYAHEQLDLPVSVLAGGTFDLDSFDIILPNDARARDRILDYGLDALVNESDRVFLCSSQPTLYSDIAAVQLGIKTGTRGAMFNAITDDPPIGRTTSLVSFNDGSITADGDATWVVIADSTSSIILFAQQFDTPKTVYSGDRFAF